MKSTLYHISNYNFYVGLSLDNISNSSNVHFNKYSTIKFIYSAYSNLQKSLYTLLKDHFYQDQIPLQN